ncbi:Fur family transcriptional regulator [Mesobacillus foraminis]|uniref:Fur family transcriptional regulator n=1 Tax=Mesobacillus foraminis TaxID=279826 RepID=UPI000EF51D4C|nr:Fur family transcriptional regulator [Mesobacillus foraminis]
MDDAKSLELIPYLKERGLRITPQRLMILQSILDHHGHPTAEEIHQTIPFTSLTTIYNNLKLFVRLGILNELPYGNALSKYEFNFSRHYHVICQECGTIVDFNYPDLQEIEQVASNLTSFEILHHHFEIYGVCASCQK